jgi:SAM-dependent methyltransferase
MSDISGYAGVELELFADATIWKAYLARQLRRYLGGRVLEVGAGIGSTTKSLCDGSARQWLCLEPDRAMAARLQQEIQTGRLPACCAAEAGSLAELAPERIFDAVLYVDVLEHIREDGDELRSAVGRLAPGGHLVVLAPAHQSLFTPFDRAIGHYRRYSRRQLLDLRPPGLTPVRGRYLDSAGLIASAGNRLLLRSATPTPSQIWLWDRVLVRASRLLDPLFGYRLGKSILVVWRRPE